MIRLLKCEYLKTKRKYIFLTAAAAMAVYFIWIFHGSGATEAELKHGWMLLLYQLPLVNTIFMPFLCIITASRLSAPEHKGIMLKQLCTIASKRRLYDAKLMYGAFIMSLCTASGCLGVILFGTLKGFGGIFPSAMYMRYFLYTLMPTLEIYIIQHTLALMFRNQAIGFFTGITGEFIGLFSLFLPNIGWLRKIIPWGHYGQLDFIGLYGWSKETRMKYIYFSPMDTQKFELIIPVLCIILYLTGAYLFERKEL